MGHAMTMAETAPHAGHRVDRLRAMVEQHVDTVARVLRRLGVPEADVDDAVQTVFLTASRRLGDIEEHAEKAFLYRTALNVAMHARRSAARRREDPSDRIPFVFTDDAPNAEELIDRRRAAEALERILDAMQEDMRVVFVLFEIEQLTTAEIAALVEVPEGTVASRLRRAREDFRERVRRMRARGGRS
jgi:RNA polymerase sigma-70 factor (ECF subfamily)